MRTAIGIILGVVAGFIVLMAVIAILAFVYVVPAVNQISNQFTATPVTSYQTSVPPSTTTTSKPIPNSTQSPVQTSSTTAEDNNINFTLEILSVSGANLSRTVTAMVINAGRIDAENCRAKIEVFSSNNRIKINGQAYLEQDLGTLKPGEPSISEVTLSFSALDAPKLLKNGVTINITLYSDQKTQTFSYDYQP
jgi:hypothetical protein